MITLISSKRELLEEIKDDIMSCGLIYPTTTGVYFVQGDIINDNLLKRCFRMPTERAAISLALSEPDFIVAVYKE